MPDQNPESKDPEDTPKPDDLPVGGLPDQKPESKDPERSTLPGQGVPEGPKAAEAPVPVEQGGMAPSPVEPGVEALPKGPYDEAGGKKWYVLRVPTGREMSVKAAIEKLKRVRNLEEKIGEIIIPTEKRMEIRGGKKTIREVKLMPGYLIVQMEMSKDIWFAVRETPGVGDFLGLKDPIPLRESEVQRLRSSAGAGEERPKLKVAFAVGENVRVKEGPFENFEGKVMEINEKKGAVKVSMEVFGRPTNVELEVWQLEKA